MKRLGVLGWPVAHGRSPAIQNAALSACGLGGSWHYQLLPLPPELFAETVPALARVGFVGVNVTVPHKARALALALASASQVSAPAAAIGAANTLLFRTGGRIDADNTDAPGLIAALERHGGVVGKHVLVLGAGGSARAAVWALLSSRAAEVRVWNRTPERADALCDELGGTPVSPPLERAEILVNCTTIGLHAADTLDALPLPAAGVGEFGLVVDFVYHRHGAALTRAARAAAVPVIDGLELLVSQGAAAFELFTGRAAPVEAMRAAAHQHVRE